MAELRLHAGLAAGILCAMGLVAACQGPEEEPLPACVEVDTACAPLYTPTFDELFTRTLKPGCALSGEACHAAEGAMGGLVYEDPDSAYNALLGLDGSAARVVPGNASCSLLAVRLEIDSLVRVMPPGDPLTAAERCVVIRWIENGAER